MHNKKRQYSTKKKTIQILEENMGINLCDLGLGSVFSFFFLDTIPKSQATKNKLYCVSLNLKTFVL
jgi:hypothetical protein